MESRRIARKNKIINEIRETELFLNRSNDTIKRIKNSQMSEVYVTNQIIKLKASIEQKNALLEKLNTDVETVLDGQLDEEIEKEYKTAEIKNKQHSISKVKIAEEKKIDKKEKTETSENYWQGIINESRAQKQNERDTKYAQKYFHKVIDTIPSYITKNLLEMPNNKGYIWRGVHLYGYLPEENGPRVMFEKKGGSNLFIHEYTNTEYKLYEKDGKNKKQLIHREQRKRKNTGNSIMDYMKKK